MERLLDFLTGVVPLPPTRFVSHEGHVDDESWVRLLEALRNNRDAVGVRLRGCGLGCIQVGQLAEVLTTNSVLEVLELPDNVIRERGAQALVDTLRLSNCTLKSVDLSGNPCYDSAPHGMQELDTLLKRNRVIKKLPKTPLTAGVGVGSRVPGAVGGTASRSANCTPTNGMSTPQLPQSFLASTGMTPLGLSFALEQRLQHLEEAEATIRSELEHVRSFSSQSEVWQKKIDAAGQQIAAILSLVDSRNLTLEARLQNMEHWRGGAEQAWAGQSKVLEDMAAQQVGLTRRVQALEGQTQSLLGCSAVRSPQQQQPSAAGSASGGGGNSRASVGLTAAASTQLQPHTTAAPNADALWQEITALRERLARLEAAAAVAGAAAAVDAARDSGAAHESLRASEEEEKPQKAAGEAGGVENQQPPSRNLPPPPQHRPQAPLPACDEAAAAGAADGARAQLTLSASLSESWSLETSSSALGAKQPGPGGRLQAAASAVQHHHQQPLPRYSKSTRDSGGLQGRRGGPSGGLGGSSLPAMEVPGSPISWHVNTFAASPGSCGVTPVHDNPMAAGLAPAVYPRDPSINNPSRAPPAAAPSATAAVAAFPICSDVSSASEDSAGSHDTAGVDPQFDASGTGFVMYAAAAAAAGAPRAAAQRYGPPHADARDSVDFAAHLRAPGQDGFAAITPGGIGGDGGMAAAGGSPGTPRGSTFSVDAEAVSLSVAMAGSAARPRAPAAGATTSDTPVLAHADSTKEPSEGDAAAVVAGSATATAGAAARTEGQAAGSRIPRHGSSAVKTTAGSCLELASPTAAGTQPDSVGTPGVSVRQWAAGGGGGACPSASGGGTSVGSLTPTSKLRPAAACTTPEAAAAAATAPAAPRAAPHLSPSLSAAAARRSTAAAAAPRAPRRSSADGRVAPPSPGGCDAQQHHHPHSGSSRPPNAVQHHHQHNHANHHHNNNQPPQKGASAAAPTSACSRDDSAAAAAKGIATTTTTHHVPSIRSGTGHAAASGGHPPHQPAAQHAAGAGGGGVTVSGHTPRSWLPGRASLQSHSIRSLAGRGDSGTGPAGKPSSGASAPLSRVSSGSAKPSDAANGLHRPTSSATNIGGVATASAAPARSASSSGVAPVAAAAANGHRVNAVPGCGADEAAAAAIGSAAVAAMTSESAGQAAAAPDLDAAKDPQVAACQADGREAAAAVQPPQAAADGGGAGATSAATALHSQAQHSSRGYRPGGMTARTLSSGTAGNVAGPVAKGGSLARTSLRGGAVEATSVAGATKRWM